MKVLVQLGGKMFQLRVKKADFGSTDWASFACALTSDIDSLYPCI